MSAHRQEPRYGDGMVTLQTEDRGEVTIPEPSWCAGHEGQPVGPMTEISHDSAPVTASVAHERLGAVELLRVGLTHAPYLVAQPEPSPLVYVQGIDAASLDAAGLRRAIAAVRGFLDDAEGLARLLDELAGGGR